MHSMSLGHMDLCTLKANSKQFFFFLFFGLFIIQRFLCSFIIGRRERMLGHFIRLFHQTTVAMSEQLFLLTETLAAQLTVHVLLHKIPKYKRLFMLVERGIGGDLFGFGLVRGQLIGHVSGQIYFD